jgi:Plasmid encoded RepA protein
MKPLASDDSKPKPFPLSPKKQLEMQLAALGASPGKKKRTLMSAADVVKRSDTLTMAAAMTPRMDRLLDASQEIRSSPADAELAFLARQLVQCTLPHANPGNIPAWARTNGNLTLGIQPGTDFKTMKSVGIPYGSVPRLLLFWINTEAVKLQTRRLELGRSLSDFMRKVGLDPSRGGPRSDAYRLKEQMRRLFAAKISFEQTLQQGNQTGERALDMLVAPRRELWWDPKQPGQESLWGSWIELSEDFFSAITKSPVPVDTRALQALKNSPLALDIYSWASYRSFTATRSNQPAFVPWPYLAAQFGADYVRIRKFREKFRAALRSVRAVYPALAITVNVQGVIIHPSKPAI